IDDEWLEIILGRASYLSFASWTLDDWGRVVVVTATLAATANVLNGTAQKLAAATVLSTTILMMLSWLGGDVLRISLIVQAQPWRALWLATVVAILLLPELATRCWKDAGLRRAGAALLGAAWLCPSTNLALILAPLSMLACC